MTLVGGRRENYARSRLRRSWPAARPRRKTRRRSVAGGLPKQGTGGLLEDPAPGGGVAGLLGPEVAHDLAHARGRDLDAVAGEHLAPLVVVGRELDRHRLEAVAGDLEP